MSNQELSLRTAFDTTSDIQIPEWLMRSDRPIKYFYETMKRWEKLKEIVKDLSEPRSLKILFPILRQHALYFPEILGFCEARSEMLKMVKTALYGVAFGCFEENQEERHCFRYHYALDTALSLMVVPSSQRCRRPAFMTEDGQVEKALSSTIQNIFKIILDQMRTEEQKGHIDYMVYACAHFSSPDSGYSKAGRRAMSAAFKDYYCQLPTDERAMITQSMFYTKNASTRELIDVLVEQARSHLATEAFKARLPSRERH